MCTISFMFSFIYKSDMKERVTENNIIMLFINCIHIGLGIGLRTVILG